MKKVFESYYKTKDAEAKINEARNTAKKGTRGSHGRGEKDAR